MQIHIKNLHFFAYNANDLFYYIDTHLKEVEECSPLLLNALLENKSFFSTIAQNSFDLRRFLKRFPMHTGQILKRILELPPLNLSPEAFDSLEDLMARENLISKYLKIFPDNVKILLKKKAPERIVINKKPSNIRELKWLIRSYPHRAETFIEKTLNQDFDLFFSSYKKIHSFIDVLPKYKAALRKKLFEGNMLFKKFLNSHSFLSMLKDFIVEKEALFHVLLNNSLLLRSVVLDLYNFKFIYRIFSPEQQKIIIDTFFSNPEHLPWLLSKLNSLGYHDFLGTDLLPYLRETLQLESTWNIITLRTVNEIHQLFPQLFYEMVPFLLKKEDCFKLFFPKPSTLNCFLKIGIFERPVIESLIAKALQLNPNPAIFFKNEGKYFGRLAALAPRLFEPLLRIILKNDACFYAIFDKWYQILACTKTFPEYKDHFIRKIIKYEYNFKKIMEVSDPSAFKENLKEIKVNFPEYSLFQLQDPLKAIEDGREKLETWSEIEKSKNTFFRSLTRGAIYSIGAFAADEQIYSSETAVEVIHDYLERKTALQTS